MSVVKRETTEENKHRKSIAMQKNLKQINLLELDILLNLSLRLPKFRVHLNFLVVTQVSKQLCFGGDHVLQKVT